MPVYTCSNQACEGALNDWRNVGADLSKLMKIIDSGVMEIFKHKPNPVTTLFANACFVFANGLDK